MLTRNGKELVQIWIYKDDRDKVLAELCNKHQTSQANVLEQIFKDLQAKKED